MILEMKRRGFLRAAFATFTAAVTDATPGINLLQEASARGLSGAQVLELVLKREHAQTLMDKFYEAQSSGYQDYYPLAEGEIENLSTLNRLISDLKKAGHPYIDEALKKAADQFEEKLRTENLRFYRANELEEALSEGDEFTSLPVQNFEADASPFSGDGPTINFNLISKQEAPVDRDETDILSEDTQLIEAEIVVSAPAASPSF